MSTTMAEPTQIPSDTKKVESAKVREICFDGIMGEKDQRLVTGLSRTTRWRMEREGKFPVQVELSPGRKGRLGAEIKAWIESRPRVGLASGNTESGETS